MGPGCPSGSHVEYESVLMKQRGTTALWAIIAMVAEGRWLKE